MKRFDCLAYKRRVQQEIYEEIKGLTPAEQIAYFNRHAESGPLGQWWRRLRRLPTTGATAMPDTDGPGSKPV